MEKLDSYHLPVTGRNILRFAFPTIVMTVFNTFCTMVDGLFVSNLRVAGNPGDGTAAEIPEAIGIEGINWMAFGKISPQKYFQLFQDAL